MKCSCGEAHKANTHVDQWHCGTRVRDCHAMLPAPRLEGNGSAQQVALRRISCHVLHTSNSYLQSHIIARAIFLDQLLLKQCRVHYRECPSLYSALLLFAISHIRTTVSLGFQTAASFRGAVQCSAIPIFSMPRVIPVPLKYRSSSMGTL